MSGKGLWDEYNATPYKIDDWVGLLDQNIADVKCPTGTILTGIERGGKDTTAGDNDPLYLLERPVCAPVKGINWQISDTLVPSGTKQLDATDCYHKDVDF